jgi:hypothetical protein
MKTTIILLALAAAVFQPARASTITGICGTGYTGNCGPLQTGAGVDGNYVLSPGNPDHVTNGNAWVVFPFNTFPIGPWAADSSTSLWIGPAGQGAEGSSDDGFGQYQYTETFSLSGYNTNSVVLLGDWGTDNGGFIVLNGVTLNISGTPIAGTSGTFLTNAGDPTSNFTSLTPFSITCGGLITCNQTTNTIQFVTQNDGGPSGLRVDLTGTGTAAVPEPASLAFVGLGLAAVGVLRRRLRSFV